MLKWILIVCGVLLGIFGLRWWTKCKKPLSSTLRTIVRSEALLLAVHIGGTLLGKPIPVNPVTALWSAFCGIPGVAALVGIEALLR